MNSDIKFSSAGIWQAVSNSYISASNDGGHTSSYANLNLSGQLGQSIILSGWSVNGGGFSSTGTITPINVGLLVQQSDGILQLQTSQYISDASTNGNWLPLIADFNGDGIQDIFLGAHNEQPNVNSASTVYLSKADGTYTKVVLADSVQIHGPTLSYVNNIPTVFGFTFGPAPIIYQYKSNLGFVINTENLDYNIGSYGDAGVVADFLGNGSLEYLQSDINWAPDFTAHPTTPYGLIRIYGLDSSLKSLSVPLATLSPYFSSSQYASYFSGNSDYQVLQPRNWVDDFNHDGKIDIVALSGIWSPTKGWPKSIIQLFQNQGNNSFKDVTDQLNGEFDKNSNPDYQMQMLDLDNSGINSYLCGQGGADLISDGSYLLLNDGTGNMYVALHSEFITLKTQVIAYAQSQERNSDIYISSNATVNFRGYLTSDGALNYVGDIFASKQLNGQWVTVDVLINAPIHFNVTSDFTQDISIADRNQSTLMRTWAGNDVIFDINANSNPTHIDGGLGMDTSQYAGSFSNYVIIGDAGSYEVRYQGQSSAAHVDDTLSNIERLQFSDYNVALDTEAPNSAGGIYRLYQAAFDRQPDLLGLGYWIDAADNGKSAVRMGEDFTWRQEFLDLFHLTTPRDNYFTGANVQTLVEGMYQHVLHRAADSGGLNYYVGVIQSHEKTVGRVLAEISDSPENHTAVAASIANGIQYTPWVDAQAMTAAASQLDPSASLPEVQLIGQADLQAAFSPWLV